MQAIVASAVNQVWVNLKVEEKKIAFTVKSAFGVLLNSTSYSCIKSDSRFDDRLLVTNDDFEPIA